MKLNKQYAMGVVEQQFFQERPACPTGESGVAIRVQNLSKCYFIYDKPQDRLKQSLYPRLQRFAGRAPRNYFREFWALKEVSFEVNKGETVGIIGRNGSGKSTLLQLICGTLTPTSGTVETRGRVAVLLELGAGFNPEFTGRENVYMNGAVLGLNKDEIDARFDAIAAFADIGEFIDQPVKIYSSGMFVRLAFAVSINVDPDILILDEALSVGDFAFRNKCVHRIKEIQGRGATILFVSHDLSTLQLICDRVAWLDSGRFISVGDPVRVCQEYYIFMTGGEPAEQGAGTENVPQQNTGAAKFVEFALEGHGGRERNVYDVGEDISFRFAMLAKDPLEPAIFGISVYRADGDWLIGQTSREASVVWPSAAAGEIVQGVFILSSNCLAPGDYLAAIAGYSEDHSLCYALTELNVRFSVRAKFPTWGKFIHPCKWIRDDADIFRG